MASGRNPVNLIKELQEKQKAKAGGAAAVVSETTSTNTAAAATAKKPEEQISTEIKKKLSGITETVKKFEASKTTDKMLIGTQYNALQYEIKTCQEWLKDITTPKLNSDLDTAIKDAQVDVMRLAMAADIGAAPAKAPAVTVAAAPPVDPAVVQAFVDISDLATNYATYLERTEEVKKVSDHIQYMKQSHLTTMFHKDPTPNESAVSSLRESLNADATILKSDAPLADKVKAANDVSRLLNNACRDDKKNEMRPSSDANKLTAKFWDEHFKDGDLNIRKVMRRFVSGLADVKVETDQKKLEGLLAKLPAVVLRPPSPRS